MPWELNCIFTVHYQPRLFCRIPRQENGCHVVRVHREQKKQQKLQHKHQEPAETKLGNILGVKQRKNRKEENRKEYEIKTSKRCWCRAVLRYLEF